MLARWSSEAGLGEGPRALLLGQEGLHLWWKAASGIARTAGLKKVELIRLGLASRSKTKS